MQPWNALLPISSIKDGQVKVANIIKDLKNPPKEYEKVYDTITDLSTAFISVTDFAINPKGNLQTFNKNVQEKIDKFMDLYNTLDAQIPNWCFRGLLSYILLIIYFKNYKS